MTDQVRANRMAVIEGWRIMAFSLGGPLGNVLSRSFDLISTVVRDGSSDAASISYSLASLKNERDLAKSMDQQRFDPLRNMLYGLSESVSTLMESIIEERGEGTALLQVQQQPLRLQPVQLQQQLLPMQQPLQLLPQQHQLDESNDASDLPTLRLVKRESEAKEQLSPDIVILEDLPCSSKQGKSTVSSNESPPAEPAQPAPIPRITIRKISEELASINPQTKRDETTQPQATPPPAKKKVTTDGKATRLKPSEPLIIRSPAFDRLIAEGAADSKEPVAKRVILNIPGRPKKATALTEERATSTVGEASSSRSSTLMSQPQTISALSVKRPRTDDPATMISSNRWKRNCAPSFEGFYNEDEEEAQWANEALYLIFIFNTH
ncbi:hypothetical protein PRIPAC_71901 [Pristionchus pacificus]|uniref:Uncharacterized protein n=1 Tax=Pristionchus pacificus TaxID=54126 RepID=A0A2A6C615_PRIPA|nr:hypothetical protein PRIPAC_71901 [Pristionchus pacificus]|eukprot:PDM73503.1 hypothetical protein PRIPAC_40859 [Pristionchus pacificus]